MFLIKNSNLPAIIGVFTVAVVSQQNCPIYLNSKYKSHAAITCFRMFFNLDQNIYFLFINKKNSISFFTLPAREKDADWLSPLKCIFKWNNIESWMQ
jgi:hypothetical protein